MLVPEGAIDRRVMKTAKTEDLILENLTFSYPEYPGVPSGPVFRDLHARFPGGSLSMVLGRPESGKTTLSRIITGLVPRHTGGSLRGTVVIPGTAGKPLPPPEIMEHLGIVFQDADEQIVMTRCDHDAAFAMESLGLSRGEMQRRISEAFELMGLSGMESRNPSSLSGGEKKKLLLAGLIAQDPDTWILDETLEEVDLPTRRKLLDYLSSRGRRMIIFASRCPGQLGRYFSSFSILSAGGVKGPFASPEDAAMIEAAGREGLYLGEPETETPPRDMAAPGEPILTAEDIRFSYAGAGGFDLSVEGLTLYRGETVCLVGRNGCGKSTLGKILCGLLRPESGRISLVSDGAPNPAAPPVLNREVGYMFQNPDYQIFLPTVAEELGYGLGSSSEVEGRLREAAGAFSLGSLEAPPALLSYGTRKRLQAASYYLLGRRVYILDEADSGLSYGDFRMILRNLSGPDRVVLVITHDVDLARVVADRIILMRDGRLVSTHRRGAFSRLEDLEGTGDR